jgi:aspartate/methionine/tyrosine aminotransferase
MSQMLKPLADRVSCLEPSGIRKVFEIANQHPEYINLSIGEPDFELPDELKAEGCKAIHEGHNRYTPTKGIPELRRIIGEQLDRRNIQYGDFIVTAGATGGLLMSLLALADSGDQILVPDPYFVAYRNLCYLVGAEPVTVDTYPDFQIKADRVEQLITDRTKALILNSPNNPTGMVYKKEELKKIVELADRYGFYIISDEVYEPFVFIDEYVSLGQLSPNAIVVNSFSKSAAMTGWRLGYTSGPAAVIEKMITLQQFTHASLNSVAQQMALKAFSIDYAPFRQSYEKKRDLVYAKLKDRFNVIKPEGGFYLFPEAPAQDGRSFFELARQAGVLIVPGKDFSQHNSHFRISFAVDDETLLEGINRLAALAPL